MKKLALGCLAVLLLLALAGGILGYYFVYRPARQYIAALSQLGSLSDLDRQVVNRATFTPPGSGELTEELVRRFASVQDAMQTQLGGKVQQLGQQYEQISRSAEGVPPRDVSAVFGALRDLAGVVTEAKRIQVNALNQAGFSVAEYQWVRDQVYRAAGAGFAEVDFKAMWDAAQKGQIGMAPQKAREEGAVPDRSRELVRPYLERVPQWIALGWLGL
jgi:hypothetical protein